MFSFNLNDWRAAIRPAGPLPDDVDVKIFLDPAFTAGLQSDSSSFACGYLDQDVLHALEISAEKWQGMALIDEAIRLILKWKAPRFDFEITPGSDFFELLLKDQIKERVKDWPVSVRGIQPSTRWRAKANRIARLDDLLKANKLVLHNGEWIDALFREVELFDPSCVQNHRRPDNGIDSLAYLAGYR